MWLEKDFLKKMSRISVEVLVVGIIYFLFFVPVQFTLQNNDYTKIYNFHWCFNDSIRWLVIVALEEVYFFT